MNSTEWFEENTKNETKSLLLFHLFQAYEDRLSDTIPDENEEASCYLDCAEDYYIYYEHALEYAKETQHLYLFDTAWRQDMEQYVINLLRGGTIEIEEIAFTDPNPETNKDIRKKVNEALEDISYLLKLKGIFASYRLHWEFKEIDSDYYLGIITYSLYITDIEINSKKLNVQKNYKYISKVYGIKSKKYEIVRKVNNTIPMYFKGDYKKIMFNEMVSNIRSKLIKDGYKITKKEIDLLINFKEEEVDNLVVYTCTIIVEDK